MGLNGEELPFLYRSYLSISMTTGASTTCSFPPLSQEAKKQHLVLLPILGSADEEIWPIVVAELLFVSQICQTPRPQVSVPVCRDFMYLTLPSSRASLFCKKWMCSVILNQLKKSSFKARGLNPESVSNFSENQCKLLTSSQKKEIHTVHMQFKEFTHKQTILLCFI